MTFTEAQLISDYRTSHGMQPGYIAAYSPAEEHIDAIIAQQLRAWYANLLRSAPPERLPQRNLAASVTQGESLSDNCLMLRLPKEGCQLVEVKLYDWTVPVRRFFPLGSPAHMRQSDSWLKSTVESPTVILDKDTIFIYGLSTSLARVAANPAARLERLIMTAPPADGSYSFDPQDYPTLNI